MMFVDEVRLVVESGAGGKGCISFLLRPDHKRVPDGGDGGDGGGVLFQADENVTDLEPLSFMKRVKAEPGALGSRNQRTGRNGPPLVVRVPCGSVLTDLETQLRIRDLERHGDSVVVAAGGRGGGGNSHGRMPRPAEPGRVVQLHVVFKLPTDVIFLGLPNSGKSTLLNRLTCAKTKVSSYPFTTPYPRMGVFRTKDARALRLCELPGLLEGSSEGRGVGNKFLKHVGRTRLLVIVLKPNNSFNLSPESAYHILLEELRKYDEHYLEIPRLILLNGADEPGFEAHLKHTKRALKQPILSISAERGDGLEVFCAKMLELLK